MHKNVWSIPDESMARLVEYAWPGNIRELQNVLERALILSDSGRLEVPMLRRAAPREELGNAAPAAKGPPDMLETVSRAHILSVLNAAGWVVAGSTGAAARLGMKRSTLHFRMKKLGIERPASARTMVAQ